MGSPRAGHCCPESASRERHYRSPATNRSNRDRITEDSQLMSALQDYRRYYPPACDELTEDELREIAPIIRQMQIDTSRIIQKLHQVQRLWERRALAASDANA